MGHGHSGFAYPTTAWAMAPMTRAMMNRMNAIPGGPGDRSDEEVRAFVKAPEGPNPLRPYFVPGYVNKHPVAGDPAVDGKLVALEDGGEDSTLFAEAKKLATTAGVTTCIVSFDSITCPVWRTHGAADMDTALAPSGVPTLHVYILEAHGQDELPVNVGPLNLAREYNQPKTITERRAAAKDALELIKGWTNGPVTMFLDDMNNALENAYEARPWRYYVIDTETKKIVDGTGFMPFNVPAKIERMKKAVKAQK